MPLHRFRPPPARGVVACVVLGWALAGACAAGAEPWIPPFNGQLAGDFKPLQLAGAPELHWTLNLGSRAENERTGILVADGPGTHLRVELQLDAAGEGTWRVTEGRLELKSWMSEWMTKGSAEVSGLGRYQNGQLSGDLSLRLKDVDLGELLKFADDEQAHVRSAQGRVEGTIGVQIRDGAFSMGKAGLTLPQGTTATILLVPSPGLLTSNVPSVVRQYRGLKAMELGETPIVTTVLRLAFDSEGAGGHVAIVRLEGHPLNPKLTAPLELDVNVNDELERVVVGFLRMRFKIGTTK